MKGRRAESDKTSVGDIVYDDIAYIYDGTVEGLFSAVFATYANHEIPSDIYRQDELQPRLFQSSRYIPTKVDHAIRVRDAMRKKCGNKTFRCILKASLSSHPDAPNAVYRFIRYAVDSHGKRDCAHCRKSDICTHVSDKGYCPKVKSRAFNDITHPLVETLFRIERSFNKECEYMRQFARFEHVKLADADFWFSLINPKDSVLPMIMDHFVERFNVQPFMIYDEVHKLAGIYKGDSWYLSDVFDEEAIELFRCGNEEEVMVQDAWRRFYKSLCVDERYNPELRVNMMPKRFWKNITELKESLPGLYR